jgi:hypothetical protein
MLCLFQHSLAMKLVEYSLTAKLVECYYLVAKFLEYCLPVKIAEFWNWLMIRFEADY